MSPASALVVADPAAGSADDEEGLVPTSEVIESLVARELGDEFRVVGPLGWGRWGFRLRAKDLHRSEEVVLTGLVPKAMANGAEEDRFLEGLSATAPLDHPHLLPVCAYGVSGGLRWFANRPIKGRSLAERIAGRGPIPFPEVRRIAQQLASALDEAHRRGIIHGVLSAADVVVDDAGWVRVREIGIAAAATDTPDAMSVEQFERIAAPGQGPDQVALASIVRSCLTGGAPATELPSDLPPSVAAALERATRPRPTERFRDLLDFVAALDGPVTVPRPILASQPHPRRVRTEEWEGLRDPPEPATSWSSLLKRWWIVAALGAVILLLASARSWFPSLDDAPPVTWSPPPSPAPAPVVTAAAPTPVAAPPRHRPAPPRAAPVRRSVAPPPAPDVRSRPEAVLLPGSLFISSRPWGELSIDGTVVGDTPLRGVVLSAGRHHLRLTHDGFVPYEATIEVPPAGAVRLTEITLKELTP